MRNVSPHNSKYFLPGTFLCCPHKLGRFRKAGGYREGRLSMETSLYRSLVSQPSFWKIRSSRSGPWGTGPRSGLGSMVLSTLIMVPPLCIFDIHISICGTGEDMCISAYNFLGKKSNDSSGLTLRRSGPAAIAPAPLCPAHSRYQWSPAGRPGCRWSGCGYLPSQRWSPRAPPSGSAAW